jgi:hypothetical protein
MTFYNVVVTLAVAPFTQIVQTTTTTEQYIVTLASVQPGTLYNVAVNAANGAQTSANITVKSFVSPNSPPKYSSFLANTGVVLSGTTTSVSSWQDQAGSARNLISPSSANFPTKTLNAAAITVIRNGTTTVNSVTTANGFVDVVNARIMPRNSDYTKMIVFNHVAQGDITNPVYPSANYFSTFGATGNCALMWRNSGNALIATSNFSTFLTPEITGPPLVAGRWYTAFVTFNNTTKMETLYLNGTQGSVQLIGTFGFASALTIDGPTGVLMLSDVSNSIQGDCLEVATWNVALTHGQVAAVVNRLAATYPSIAF